MEIQADPQKVIQRLSSRIAELTQHITFLEVFIEDNVNTKTVIQNHESNTPRTFRDPSSG